MNLTTAALLKRIEIRLAAEEVPYLRRILQGLAYARAELGDKLPGEVEEYFFFRYTGDLKKVTMGNGSKPRPYMVLLHGMMWQLHLPESLPHGQHYTLFEKEELGASPVSRTIEGDSAYINVKGLFPHMTNAYSTVLTESEEAYLVDRYYAGSRLYAALTQMSFARTPPMTDIYFDFATGVQRCWYFEEDRGGARWSFQSAVEKAIKALYVLQRGSIPKKVTGGAAGHDVFAMGSDLSESWPEAVVSPDLLRKVRCSPMVRYNEQGTSLQQLDEALTATTELLTHYGALLLPHLAQESQCVKLRKTWTKA